MAKRFLSKKAKRAATSRAAKHLNGGKKPKQPKETGDLLAGAGDNGPKTRDFKYHYDQARGLKAKVDEANGRYRDALKKAKEAGINPKVITETMAWAKKDPLEAATFFKQLQATFEIGGVEVQLDMFGAATVSRTAQIFDDGYRAGKAAKSTDENPHNASTKKGQTWLQGWHEGQSENAGGIGKTPEKSPNEGDDEVGEEADA